MPLSSSPSSAAIVPFRATVPQESIADLHQRLSSVRLPDKGTHTGFDHGVPTSRIAELVRYWRDEYDWRRFEAELAEIPQFRTEIDGLAVHFIHVRSRHADALPIVLTHGWPGSFVEFLNVIGPLTDPERYGGTAADAFHVVIPSLPGYGFSDKPTEPGWTLMKIARAWDVLMDRLGYDHYVAQGGDWGASISTWMAKQRPPGLAGIHLNIAVLMNPVPLSDTVTAEEQAALDQLDSFGADSAYAALQQTRPQTIGYALADSAVGQAAWIYEKCATWSDTNLLPEQVIGWDRLLDNISVYWFTNTAASSARLYAESLDHYQTIELDLPVAISVFPGETYTPPRLWAERVYTNLIYFNADIERGGHFPAFEQPELFVGELRKSFQAGHWRASGLNAKAAQVQ